MKLFNFPTILVYFHSFEFLRRKDDGIYKILFLNSMNSTHILVNKLSFGYSIMYLAYKILHLHITFTLLYVIRNDFAR